MEKFFPCDGYLFDTHTNLQNEFIKRIGSDGIDSALEWLKDNKVYEEEYTYPEKLNFRWEKEDTDNYVFELSEDADFKEKFVLKCNSPECEIDNLKIGQKYFWRVNGGEVHTFETKDNLFRFIKIDGPINVRDIGGVNIKQGMVYRGGMCDNYFAITEEGKTTFCDILKIKTDLDVRSECVGVLDASPVGENVVLKLLPYRPYKEVFEEKHIKGICEIMEVFADEDNYPIYMHCRGGADRTGMIALYLRALLGESDDIIHTDFELTSLSSYTTGASEGVAEPFRSRNAEYYTEFLDMLDKYAPSKPLSEKIKAFLIDCGVSEDTINKIKDILRADK